MSFLSDNNLTVYISFTWHTRWVNTTEILYETEQWYLPQGEYLHLSSNVKMFCLISYLTNTRMSSYVMKYFKITISHVNIEITANWLKLTMNVCFSFHVLANYHAIDLCFDYFCSLYMEKNGRKCQ